MSKKEEEMVTVTRVKNGWMVEIPAAPAAKKRRIITANVRGPRKNKNKKASVQAEVDMDVTDAVEGSFGYPKKDTYVFPFAEKQAMMKLLGTTLVKIGQ